MLTLFTGQKSYLTLPIRPARADDENLRPFEPPEGAPVIAHKALRSATRQRTVHRDLISGLATLTDFTDNGSYHLLDSQLEVDASNTDIFTIVADDPLSAGVRCERVIKVGRGDWQTRVETSSEMSATAEDFLVTNLLNAYEGNTRVFTKSWTATIPRDLV